MALGPNRPGLMLPMRIWDLPTRLFHWSLLLAVVVCYVSVKFDNMTVHMLSGEFILALLIFRIVWGFIGSDTARFTQFLRSPIAAIRHLLHFPRREPDTVIGHNEAGGWMVIVMLAILAVQVGSGLFANDTDSFIAGPLAGRISEEAGGQALMLHGFNFDLLKFVVLMHVLAIIGYALVKRHDLVRPMLTGKKRLPAATRAPRMASPGLAAAVLVISAMLVWVLVKQFGK